MQLMSSAWLVPMQATVLDGITSNTIIHIRARFPSVRYFSYQVRPSRRNE